MGYPPLSMREQIWRIFGGCEQAVSGNPAKHAGVSSLHLSLNDALAEGAVVVVAGSSPERQQWIERRVHHTQRPNTSRWQNGREIRRRGVPARC